MILIKFVVYLTMIEQEDGFYDLFRIIQAGIHVKIGRENNNSAMEDCSLITATYSIGDRATRNNCDTWTNQNGIFSSD